ncbi:MULTISPECIES: hypothetical protein [unclassified Pseudomonas]|uniref:hypothetical protein n=1 Tax=unclassified Pseudomonas TaxID=196821 RepID=UPI00257F3EDD|nr:MULTISPECIES: hypothetical protein [unclassified Pseudomonas]
MFMIALLRRLSPEKQIDPVCWMAQEDYLYLAHRLSESTFQPAACKDAENVVVLKVGPHGQAQ